ncbi:MAG: hypothetical protein N3G22_00585 [Candidatus Micrarchaeota archaeon]|nr:hypothetical protein [Candidatus Micrarchaeota archaeon]
MLLGKFVPQPPILEEAKGISTNSLKAGEMERAFLKVMQLKDYYAPAESPMKGFASDFFADLFSTFHYTAVPRKDHMPKTHAQLLLESIARTGYGAADIAEFVLLLRKYQHEKNFSDRAGLFLSDLINACKDDEFIISLRHLDVRINYLGCRNKKDVVVKGNLGDYSAKGMVCGRFVVEGSCGNFTGSQMVGGQVSVIGDVLDFGGEKMEGGVLNVVGNARNWVGCEMKGGEIFVLKNAMDYTGYRASGGKIHVFGDVRDYTGFELQGATIFLGGKSRHYTGYKKLSGEIIFR